MTEQLADLSTLPTLMPGVKYVDVYTNMGGASFDVSKDTCDGVHLFDSANKTLASILEKFITEGKTGTGPGSVYNFKSMDEGGWDY